MAQGVIIEKLGELKPLWASDIDGVVCSMTKTANRLILEKHGCDLGEPDCWDWVDKGGPDAMETFKAFLKGGEYVDLWEEMEPIPGAVDGIKTIQQYFDVRYVTHRGDGLSIATERWLHSQGIFHPVVHNYNKWEVDAAVYVDDHGPTVQSILDHTSGFTKVFLFDQAWNREYTDLDPYRIYGWEQLASYALYLSRDMKRLDSRWQTPYDEDARL